jgi:hypothetical protein
VRGKRRIWTLVIGIIGLLLVAGSFIWRSAVVDKLVIYPDDVDETPIYEGEVTLHVDPVSTAPLDPPRTFPLRVERHIQAVTEETTSSTVVVKETIRLAAEGLFEGVEENQYVMNRETVQNLADPRAFAYDPANVVDRSGLYRIQFPFDTQEQPYPIYVNETGKSYDATPSGTGEIEGLSVINFAADLGYEPASEPYLVNLDKALGTPLPRELTLDKLNPLLATAGIDIPALLPALLPALSEADREIVLGLAQRPVPLVYLFKASGSDAVEPSTGSIVEVRDLVQTVAAAPDPSVLPVLQDLLSRYTQVAGIPAALEALQRLAAEPIVLFENRFTQTEASIADIASTVSENADQKNLAENTIPNILLIAGIVLAVAGFALFAFWKKPSRGSEPEKAAVSAAQATSAPIGPSEPADEGAPVTESPLADGRPTGEAPAGGSMETPPAEPPGGSSGGGSP